MAKKPTKRINFGKQICKAIKIPKVKKPVLTDLYALEEEVRHLNDGLLWLIESLRVHKLSRKMLRQIDEILGPLKVTSSRYYDLSLITDVTTQMLDLQHDFDLKAKALNQQTGKEVAK